jgi:hypothetical protein
VGRAGETTDQATQRWQPLGKRRTDHLTAKRGRKLAVEAVRDGLGGASAVGGKIALNLLQEGKGNAAAWERETSGMGDRGGKRLGACDARVPGRGVLKVGATSNKGVEMEMGKGDHDGYCA